MKKENYTPAEIEIILFSELDVITECPGCEDELSEMDP